MGARSCCGQALREVPRHHWAAGCCCPCWGVCQACGCVSLAVLAALMCPLREERVWLWAAGLRRVQRCLLASLRVLNLHCRTASLRLHHVFLSPMIRNAHWRAVERPGRKAPPSLLVGTPPPPAPAAIPLPPPRLPRPHPAPHPTPSPPAPPHAAKPVPPILITSPSSPAPPPHPTPPLSSPHPHAARSPSPQAAGLRGGVARPGCSVTSNL